MKNEMRRKSVVIGPASLIRNKTQARSSCSCAERHRGGVHFAGALSIAELGRPVLVCVCGHASHQGEPSAMRRLITAAVFLGFASIIPAAQAAPASPGAVAMEPATVQKAHYRSKRHYRHHRHHRHYRYYRRPSIHFYIAPRHHRHWRHRHHRHHRHW